MPCVAICSLLLLHFILHLYVQAGTKVQDGGEIPVSDWTATRGTSVVLTETRLIHAEWGLICIEKLRNKTPKSFNRPFYRSGATPQPDRATEAPDEAGFSERLSPLLDMAATKETGSEKNYGKLRCTHICLVTWSMMLLLRTIGKITKQPRSTVVFETTPWIYTPSFLKLCIFF